MPFMKGPAPVRRTLQYLNAGRIVFKERVKVFSVNYNTAGDHHEGARQFVFWALPQIQFKNPSVQVITFKNMTPSPFIRAFLEDGSDVLVDLDSKGNDEIQAHVMKVLCKTPEQLAAEEKAKMVKENIANFGFGCRVNCICRIPGQVPCPGLVPLPNHMRGKFLMGERD